MDILRKELNGIYEAQHLERESLSPEVVADACDKAGVLVEVNGACAVVTDVSCDRCYIHTGGFGALMGFAAPEGGCRTVGSSDEDEIYERIHPEDLVEKRMLEYEFFKTVDPLPPERKTRYKATCRIRMKDRDGVYRNIANSTQVLALSPAGRIWLVLCCYDLSGVPATGEGIGPQITDNTTGEIIRVATADGKCQILSSREKEILRLIQEGLPSKQIAARLGISIHTVNRHRQNIIGKLSVGNSVEAVMAAVAMKLL